MNVELRHQVRAALEVAGVVSLPEQYAARGTSAGQRSVLGAGGHGERRPEKQQGLKWVTIGGSAEGDKKHVGGSPVQIDGKGNIHKGAEWATSKGATNVKHLGGEGRKEASETSPAKPAQAAESKAKEPWEMTLAELNKTGYVGYDTASKRHVVKHQPGGGNNAANASEHERAVASALSAGKTVPPEVLADYPDLKPKAAEKPESTSQPNDMTQAQRDKLSEYQANTDRKYEFFRIDSSRGPMVLAKYQIGTGQTMFDRITPEGKVEGGGNWPAGSKGVTDPKMKAILDKSWKQKFGDYEPQPMEVAEKLAEPKTPPAEKAPEPAASPKFKPPTTDNPATIKTAVGDLELAKDGNTWFKRRAGGKSWIAVPKAEHARIEAALAKQQGAAQKPAVSPPAKPETPKAKTPKPSADTPWTRDRLSQMDGQGLKHLAQDRGVLGDAYNDTDSGKEFKQAVIDRVLQQQDVERQQKSKSVAEADKRSGKLKEWAADLPKYTDKDLADELGKQKLAGRSQQVAMLQNEIDRRKPKTTDKPAAAPKQPRQSSALDQAITEAVGDRPRDRERFAKTLDETHKRHVEQVTSENESMRQIMAQFGYSGARQSAMIRAAKQAGDLDAFQRAGYPLDKMAQMIESDPSTYAGLMRQTGGESAGREDVEAMLFNRLKEGGLVPVPAKHDPKVVEDAKAQFQQQGGGGRRQETKAQRRERMRRATDFNPADFEPFAALFAAVPVRYQVLAALELSGLVESYAARKKSSNGQSSLFERQHPRADDGTFVDKDGGQKKPSATEAEPGEFKLSNQEPKPKQAEFEDTKGQQGGLFSKSGLHGQMGLFVEPGQPKELTRKEEPEPLEPEKKGPAGITIKEAFRQAKDAGAVKKYEQAVSATFRYTGTKSADWKGVKVKRMATTAKPDGTEVEMPEFDFPTGYDHAVTPFTDEHGGGGESACCELCGTPIRNVWWIQNDNAKLTMMVGSECVRQFGKGQSGEQKAKTDIAAARRTFLDDIVKVQRELVSRFKYARELRDYYGNTRKQMEWLNTPDGKRASELHKALHEARQHKTRTGAMIQGVSNEKLWRGGSESEPVWSDREIANWHKAKGTEAEDAYKAANDFLLGAPKPPVADPAKESYSAAFATIPLRHHIRANLELAGLVA